MCFVVDVCVVETISFISTQNFCFSPHTVQSCKSLTSHNFFLVHNVSMLHCDEATVHLISIWRPPSGNRSLKSKRAEWIVAWCSDSPIVPLSKKAVCLRVETCTENWCQFLIGPNRYTKTLWAISPAVIIWMLFIHSCAVLSLFLAYTYLYRYNTNDTHLYLTLNTFGRKI